mmetsp:Transcript_18799/g.55132  ORF Transcript_18799/g.55132 Transcript_18799/m.55132 type:complete len:145 (-) Transcript_18799:139-573(-)
MIATTPTSGGKSLPLEAAGVTHEACTANATVLVIAPFNAGAEQWTDRICLNRKEPSAALAFVGCKDGMDIPGELGDRDMNLQLRTEDRDTCFNPKWRCPSLMAASVEMLTGTEHDGKDGRKGQRSFPSELLAEYVCDMVNPPAR